MPEAVPHPDTEMSKKKDCETTIGELRKAYGARARSLHHGSPCCRVCCRRRRLATC